MGEELNISDLQEAADRELERLRKQIFAAIGPLFSDDTTLESQVFFELSKGVYKWQCATENGSKTGGYTWREDFWRNWSEEQALAAERARQGFKQLIYSLPCSFEMAIIEELERKGMSVDHLNTVLSAFEDVIEEVETHSADLRQQWLDNYAGNRPTPRAYLRIELDDVVQRHVKPRYRRARIIAATEAAISIIDSAEIESETRRVNSFLREHGR